MRLLRWIALRILGIKENPFLKIWVAYEHGEHIYIYAGHKGERYIKDKLDLWPRGQKS
jgi:hypothetical protein